MILDDTHNRARQIKRSALTPVEGQPTHCTQASAHECVDRWRRCDRVSYSRQQSHDTPHAPASHVAHHMPHTSTESSLFTAFGLTDWPGPPTLPKRIHLVPSPSNFKPAAAAAAAAAAVDSSCNSSATSKSQIFGLINKRHNALMNQIITRELVRQNVIWHPWHEITFIALTQNTSTNDNRPSAGRLCPQTRS